MSYVLATSIEGYTPREIERAARDRKLYHDLSAENIRNVKVWLRSNQCKNVPILVDDVNLAEKIYLADVATLKGKSVRPHPPVVTRNDMIELPPELMIEGRKIELAIDIVYINGDAFLHSVERSIRYNGIVCLGKRGMICTQQQHCVRHWKIFSAYITREISTSREYMQTMNLSLYFGN